MDNLDDSENNAKISDSAYSNSCSNSQSRRSRSSKSTHSGSNSSGSSGYGGKQSNSGSGSSNDVIRQPPVKRPKDKDGKHKNELSEIQTEAEFRLPHPAQPSGAKKEEQNDAPVEALQLQAEKGVQHMETLEETETCDDTVICHVQCPMQVVANRNSPSDGFSCVISMHDGIVMYTTSSLTNAIGFPKDMWIGRSFIDFIHPLDHSTFASQITHGLAVPKKESPNDAVQSNDAGSTMFCRIRKYRGLAGGYGVKERTITFVPFTLKLNFKNNEEDKGMLIYLVIQATPLCSAFKSAHEILVKAVSFVIRHVSNGNLEHIDPEAVPFLGYFPQDVHGKDVLRLYHPDDLTYIRQMYETIVKEGVAPRSKPHRLMAQNGGYLKLETEWTSFVNPWSRKLEFVIAKHHVLEGPANPDVFESPVVITTKEKKCTEDEKNKAQSLRDNIIRIMNKVLTKPAEFAKQQMSKCSQDLASFMENLIQDSLKAEQPELLKIQEPANDCERDSEIMGGISPHHEHHSESKSSSGTPLSYNQLNFNDNLQRFFDNHQELSFEEYEQAIAGHLEEMKDNPLIGGCLSPMAVYSADSADVTSSGESSSGQYVFKKQREINALRLTESLLIRHNTDMEKSLVKKHRDCRSASKEEREKESYATKQKKKEHLARCNASFVPTAENSKVVDIQAHGLKRPLKQLEEQPGLRKHHCPGQRPPQRLHAGSPDPAPGSSTTAFSVHRLPNSMRKPGQFSMRSSSFAGAPSVAHVTNAEAASYQSPKLNDMIPLMPNIGITPHATIMSPLPAGPGLMPILYVPTTAHAIPSTPAVVTTAHPYPAQPMQYLMYGPAVVGSPIMMTPMSAPAFSLQETMVQYATPRTPATTKTRTCNYEKTAQTILRAPQSSTDWKHKVPEKKSATGSGNETANSDDPIDRTDAGSSYSSFYSSFFKTESGSADDSGDSKKTKTINDANAKDGKDKKVIRRKKEPSWMEQVCVNPELIYKYQIKTKDEDEVLAADREKMATLEQPALVNEQLEQLYKDLQLEGVAAQLTLEEGLTCSSSSSDEAKSSEEGPVRVKKRVKKKREHAELVMIFEEDAPIPSPQCEEGAPSTSVP